MLINLIINKLPPRKSQIETVRGRCDGRRNLVFRAEARKINSNGRGPEGINSKNDSCKPKGVDSKPSHRGAGLGVFGEGSRTHGAGLASAVAAKCL